MHLLFELKRSFYFYVKENLCLVKLFKLINSYTFSWVSSYLIPMAIAAACALVYRY